MANVDHNIVHIRNIYRALSSSEKRLFIKYLRLSEAKNLISNSSVAKKTGKSRKGDLSVKFIQIISKHRQESLKPGMIDIVSKSFTSMQRRNLGNRVLKKLWP